MDHIRCSCAEGICVKGVEPASDCIARLDGVVESVRCDKCENLTWHHDGECVRCQRLERDKSRQAAQNRTVKPSRPRNGGRSEPAGLTLTIKCGNEFVVSDKATVAKILKILLEDK